MFAGLYGRVMRWAAHRHAPRYLAALSFAESSFFPVPPDVLLVPLCAARPERVLRLGLLTTIFSTIGGLFGYLLGLLAFDLVSPLLDQAGYWGHITRVEAWCLQYGAWTVFVAGFSPLPYKVFTLTAGAMSMALLPFLVASFVGRGSRFMLVSVLIAAFGARVEPWVRRWVEWFGWLSILLVSFVLVWLTVRG